METNVNYTIVGIFVVILTAALVFSIIWLSSGFTTMHTTTYIIYEQESVSGLSIDSPVEYNGVSVGSVTSIDLDDKNPQIVKVLISIQTDTPVTQGTIATLKSRGVTGITFVALNDKSNDLTPLTILPGEKYPIIKTGPSLFTRLDTALSSLSTNLEQVTKSIQSVLDTDNQQSIKAILNNLSDVTGTLAENSKRLTEIVTNASKASQQFMPLMQSSMSAMRIIETQTLPATYRMLNNLDNITRALNEVSIELKQNPSILIRGVDHQPTGPGERK